MTATEPRRVVIIGAGPAGLAAGVCLGRHGIDYTILERGSSPVAALARVDPEMLLLSPSRLSRLPGMELDVGTPSHMTFRAFTGMLEQYRVRHGVAVTTNATVVHVGCEGSGFKVQYRADDGSTRTITGSEVINAAGTSSSPVLPETFHPEACSFRWKHSLDVRTADLALARRLLVVGGGASAAEVLDRWLEVRSLDARAWMSLRSPLRAIVNPVLGIDIHYFVWLPERLPVRFLGWRVGRLGEPMNGRHVLPAIRRGLITKLPAVDRYVGRSVQLRDGRGLEPDLVVFATGFRYDTSHLAGLLDYDPDGRPLVRRCESTRVSGLYLLGFRYGRAFASPYIRGIGRDAAFVARRIARRHRAMEDR